MAQEPQFGLKRNQFRTQAGQTGVTTNPQNTPQVKIKPDGTIHIGGPTRAPTPPPAGFSPNRSTRLIQRSLREHGGPVENPVKLAAQASGALGNLLGEIPRSVGRGLQRARDFTSTNIIPAAIQSVDSIGRELNILKNGAPVTREQVFNPALRNNPDFQQVAGLTPQTPTTNPQTPTAPVVTEPSATVNPTGTGVNFGNGNFIRFQGNQNDTINQGRGGLPGEVDQGRTVGQGMRAVAQGLNRGPLPENGPFAVGTPGGGTLTVLSPQDSQNFSENSAKFDLLSEAQRAAAAGDTARARRLLDAADGTTPPPTQTQVSPIDAVLRRGFGLVNREGTPGDKFRRQQGIDLLRTALGAQNNQANTAATLRGQDLNLLGSQLATKQNPSKAETLKLPLPGVINDKGNPVTLPVQGSRDENGKFVPDKTAVSQVASALAAGIPSSIFNNAGSDRVDALNQWLAQFGFPLLPPGSIIDDNGVIRDKQGNVQTLTEGR